MFMNTLFQDKKIILLLLAFIILFPLGIFGLRIQSPPQAQYTTPSTQQKAEHTTDVLPQSGPQKRLLDYIQHRRPLSEADMRAKTRILGTAEQAASGIVYQNTNIAIEYVKSADLFQVEILTAEIPAAKEEAIVWFKSQGFSNEGICALPVSFYLNFDIKTQLGKAANSFNPLPESC